MLDRRSSSESRPTPRYHGTRVGSLEDLNALIQDIKKDHPVRLGIGRCLHVDITSRQLFQAIGVDQTKTSPVVFAGDAGANRSRRPCFHDHHQSKDRTAFRADRRRPYPAVTAPKRLDWLPDVPTTAESGLPQVDYQFWGAISGPPGLPEDVVAAWDRAVQELLKDPAFVKELNTRTAMYPSYAGQKEFKALVEAEIKTLVQLFPPVK